MQLKKHHIRKSPTYQPDPHQPNFAPNGIHRQSGDFDQANNHSLAPKTAKGTPPMPRYALPMTPREREKINCERINVIPPNQGGNPPLTEFQRSFNGRAPKVTAFFPRPEGTNW